MKFKVALVGCGSIAETHAKILQKHADEVELRYCVDKIAERAFAMADQYGGEAATYGEVLSDETLDAVVLCTSSGDHGALAIEAMEAGKHVLLEKPMEISSDRCDAIIAAQRKSGRVFSVVSQHRFDPASEKVKALVSSGRLGNIFGCDIQVPWFRSQEYYDEADWRGTSDLDGGCLRNQGIHTLDLMLWLVGPVREVWARTLIAGHERIDAPDHMVAAFIFESGAVGNLTCSTSVYPGFPARLSLYGTAGTAVIEGDEIHTVAIQGEEVERGRMHEEAYRVASGGTRAAKGGCGDDENPSGWEWGSAHEAQWRDFFKCCREGGTPRVTGADGRDAIAFIEAVHRSSESLLPVTLF